MEEDAKKLIVVGGPTGVGKTALAIELAQHFTAEIISADSRQVYQQLKIGVGRPSDTELNSVKHHLIGHVDIEQHYNAADFESDALQCLKEIFSKNQTAILCGGTGLYIQTLCDGMDALPAADLELRAQLEAQFHSEGIAFLQEYIQTHDPELMSSIDMQNHKRLIRAVEIMMISGEAYSSLKKGRKTTREFQPVFFCLSMNRDVLKQRINKRVDQMIEEGWLEEAKTLFDKRHLKSMQTVGYRELFDFIEGKSSWESTVELIKTHTWQYARRQLTWFRRDERYTWVESKDEILNKLAELQTREG